MSKKFDEQSAFRATYEKSPWNPANHPQAALQGHTPGPWTAYDQPNCMDGNGESVVPIHAPFGKHLQSVATVYGTTSEAREANARLIAAAPEMLEALREVEGFCPIDWQDRIRAMIAKAGG